MKQKDAAPRKRGPNVWVIRYRGKYSVKEEGRAGYLVPPVPQRIAIVHGALALLIIGGFAAGYQQLMLERQHDRLVVRAEITGGGSIVSKDVRDGPGSRGP